MVPRNSEANLPNRASSLGILDRLPAELLDEVLGRLDFQSAIRFSRVSFQGRDMLCSLPVFRDVIKHAPHALAALSQTKLLHLHSASELYNALRSERCVLCPEYGAYLFLPACQRCCWHCLRSNPLLWVTLREKCLQDFRAIARDGPAIASHVQHSWHLRGRR